MVFESLIVELLNKYLGDYIENLDKSQLKLSLWGGKQNVDICFSVTVLFPKLIHFFLR